MDEFNKVLKKRACQPGKYFNHQCHRLVDKTRRQDWRLRHPHRPAREKMHPRTISRRRRARGLSLPAEKYSRRNNFKNQSTIQAPHRRTSGDTGWQIPLRLPCYQFFLSDLRVSIVPTYHGENAVMRLLSDKADNFSLENLGFNDDDQKKILTALKKSSGMILAYRPNPAPVRPLRFIHSIKMLNKPSVSIAITIEDSLSSTSIGNIEQIQVNARAGLEAFANGLAQYPPPKTPILSWWGRFAMLKRRISL